MEGAGNVADCAGNVTECTGNVTEGTADVTECTGDVVECTRDVAECARNVTEGTGNVAECTGNVMECTRNVMEGTGNVTEGARDVRITGFTRVRATNRGSMRAACLSAFPPYAPPHRSRLGLGPVAVLSRSIGVNQQHPSSGDNGFTELATQL